MKLSNGFDARRLRPRGAVSWKLRFVLVLASLIAGSGLMAMAAGISTLVGHPTSFGALNDSTEASLVLLSLGLVIFWIGALAWRSCRRRTRKTDDLSLSPRLLKKRN